MESIASTHRFSRTAVLPFIIFTLAASFYLYEFIFQVAPGVMSNELMAYFRIDAATFGTMSACYFFAYSPMQIPAGLLYDRFGPRKLLTIAILICAVGGFLFAASNQVLLAAFGRFFMGIGSAFAFLGVLVLIANWFPAKQFGLMAGIAQLMSSAGAMVGNAPVSAMVSAMGWQQTIVVISLIGLVLAFFIWHIVRDQPVGRVIPSHHEDERAFVKKLLQVCRRPQTWFIGIYVMCLWAPITIFAALWGVPYFQTLYSTSATLASGLIMMVWFGIAVGSPLFGWWSDHIGSRCRPLGISAGLGLVTSLIVLYVPNISMTMMYVLMFVFGVAASGQVVSFAVVNDINRRNYVGTASGFNNMMTVMGGLLFQPLVGFLLRIQWDGTMLNNAPLYTTLAYERALCIVPICFLISLIMSTFFIKETHCEPLSE
ncbi:MAG: MFS transporter [Proteobacteria bacterium]|nr:MFS transporter [Pseudomonadota bacterium]